MLAVHTLYLSGPAIERIQNSKIKELSCNEFDCSYQKKKKLIKLHELSVAPLIGEAIIRVHEEQSVSTLFD